MNEYLVDFFSLNILHVNSYELIHQLLGAACKEARITAVPVADSFGHTDNFLNSAIGRYDGDVYNALIDSTKDEELNNEDVSESYHLYIQYILHPERKIPKNKL